MSTVDELHPKAIDLAEQAFSLQKKGDNINAKKLFLEALKFEQQAALLLSPTQESEPSRSILFRSAASLAFKGGDYESADWLIANGLSGYPPSEIKEELKNLYDDVNFMRHLSAKGIELSNREWLMTLSGNDISYGKTNAELLMTRVEKVTTLYYRTVERLLKLPYRVKGSVNPEIKEKYGLYISALLPGSFAVAFQVGKPYLQISLFPDIEPKEPINPEIVIDEVMSCFEILESINPDELKERIVDKTYYENFVGLAKQIAPDGDKVKLVGFTVKRNGSEKPVALRKSKKQLQQTPDTSLLEDSDKDKNSAKVYTGILMHAHSPRIRKFGTVKLLDASSGEEQTIRVPIALMKDIVQPYYEENVKILVLEKKGKYYLEEIELLTI